MDNDTSDFACKKRFFQCTTLNMVAGLQIKLARTALGWTTIGLAERAGVAPSTVTRVEGGAGCTVSKLAALQQALEAAGIEFVNEGKRIGVTVEQADG